MSLRIGKLLNTACFVMSAAAATHPGAYVGSAVCAQCHRTLAATQAKTNMARTWQGTATRLLAPVYKEEYVEGAAPAIVYRAARTPDHRLNFETILPGHAPARTDVEDVIGSDRHGISFLARLHDIDGTKLVRDPLLETRYLHSTHENALVLSPGFPEVKPMSYESALGRALSLSFEKKCLDCHGQPSPENATGGIRCESCHGPGSQHLESIAAGKSTGGIANFRQMNAETSMESCAHCHSGFNPLSDPIPDDLLISSQVVALKNSECYVQSAGALQCISCHDPHDDSPPVAAKSVQTCLQCHGAKVERHAALCPVNRDRGCLGCHMPNVKKGSFTMADHWIGVHPEQHTTTPATHAAEWKTQVRPRRVFIRIIVTDNAAKAAQAYARLQKGDSFFDVARDTSIDGSAPGGGYLGEMWLDKMDPKLAAVAAELRPGDFSPVLDAGTRHTILGRLPRDFRWQADRLQQQATELRTKGLLAQAADKYQEALRIYPQFLRALIFLGSTFGQEGNPERAAGILEFAARLYPDDPAAQYNLGIAYGALGRGPDEIHAYRRALEIEPDLLPAYQNLGAALYSSGQAESALDVYRKGLEVDPLSAVLYYNVGIVENNRGNSEQANAAIAIARKIDPEFVKQQEGGR